MMVFEKNKNMIIFGKNSYKEFMEWVSFIPGVLTSTTKYKLLPVYKVNIIKIPRPKCGLIEDSGKNVSGTIRW